MNQNERKLFGTDGVRGKANEHPMTPEMAVQIGRGAACIAKKDAGKRAKIIIGKDTRLSGYMLENAIASGICSMGVDALLAGLLPTPGIAFLTTRLGPTPGLSFLHPTTHFKTTGSRSFLMMVSSCPMRWRFRSRTSSSQVQWIRSGPWPAR